MELSLVLERLAFTIEKAKELKPEQFKYESYISKFDFDTNCGTICCIVGHYPNWNINGFIYKRVDIMYPRLSVRYEDNKDVDVGLMIHHGLSDNILGFLFYGYNLNHDLFVNLNSKYSPINICLKLHEVIQRFEYVYELLKTGEITPDFTA